MTEEFVHQGSAKPRGLWMGAALLSALLLGSAVGLQIRDRRLGGQISMALQRVEDLQEKDDYLSARVARDWRARLYTAQQSDSSLAWLAAAQARLSGEFGDDASTAEGLLAKVQDGDGLAAREARAYLSLSRGRWKDVALEADLIIAHNDELWIGHYLKARAEVLAGHGDAAKGAAMASLALHRSPLVYVTLAQAEALRSRIPEALAVLAQAEQFAKHNTSVLLLRARLRTWTSDAYENNTEDREALRQVVNDARSGTAASATEGAWASLLLAAMSMQDGNEKQARALLNEARSVDPKGWDFSERLAEVLIDWREWESALVEIDESTARWPDRASLRVLKARVLLLQFEPNAALEALGSVLEIEGEPLALTARGRAYLQLGQLESASRDLDAVLLLRPKLLPASIARARVDVLQGKPGAAVTRLARMYHRNARISLSVAYASALRETRRFRRARSLLSRVLRKIVVPEGQVTATLSALLELARIDRATGRRGAARKALDRAVTLAPKSVQARLQRAQLQIDQGRVEQGRDGLDTLVAEGAWTGDVLLACARARILSGRGESAVPLLERVDERWLESAVARERGRLALTRGRFAEALSALTHAEALGPRDPEIRLLLMETYVGLLNVLPKPAAPNAPVSNVLAQDALKSMSLVATRFRRSFIGDMARGITALLEGHWETAVEAFRRTRSRLLTTKGSRLNLAEVSYWLGRSYFLAHKRGEALEWFRKALELRPNYGAALFWIGEVHRQKGD